MIAPVSGHCLLSLKCKVRDKRLKNPLRLTMGEMVSPLFLCCFLIFENYSKYFDELTYRLRLSCERSLPFGLLVRIFHFDFEDRILVLIASGPGHCLSFTYIHTYIHGYTIDNEVH